MIDIMRAPDLRDLAALLPRFWARSAETIDTMQNRLDPAAGAPVYTVDGRYTARGWTEWTQGFQYGSALLQYDATGERRFLDLGSDGTMRVMAPHLTHTGVHDHGFNNVSTYGALLRMAGEGRIEADEGTRAAYRIALSCSAAVQASRWTDLGHGEGFIHSFNGPHSLFADTIRSLRVLALGHALGHVLLGEHDERTSLLDRLLAHARTTAAYNVYYGRGRDGYDVRGRVAHESIFNVTDGQYRCPSTQQGYSPFTTWTRGLAWILCGYAELLEFLEVVDPAEVPDSAVTTMVGAACAAADFYLANTPTCGVPYWDTGAPGLAALGEYLERPADPWNDHEPVDSSAAAIAAQGLLRLGRYLSRNPLRAERTGRGEAHLRSPGEAYWRAGLTTAGTLLREPYLGRDPSHEGLLLHAVYHWPNRWDHVPAGRKVASGESCMWGDYHLRELALYLQRLADDGPYLTFFSGIAGQAAS